MDITQTTTHISLCAGYGGIDLGLKRAIPNLRTVAFSEIEAFACANLVSKMEAGLLDPAPIWTNLKTFPWESFRGKVDILSGGYPCQPFSSAGKRLGKDDPRHLWPYIADGIRILQPALCFFENVEGHLTLGLRDVLHDLGELGYRTTWGIFSASEVGAPHQRKRVFVLAHRADLGSQVRYIARSQGAGPTGDAVPRCKEVAYAASWRRKGLSDWNPESAYASSRSPWPSRPGQPQFGWEPPRVVGLENAASKRSRSQSGNTLHQGRTASEAGSASLSEDARRQNGAAIPDHQPAGGNGEPPSVVGNARSQESSRLSSRAGRDEVAEAGQSGEGLGNTQCPRLDGCAGAGMSGPGRPSGVAAGADQENRELGEIEPTLGRDPDGPAGGLGYAQLCVAGDNRTDELRLLGNGVVPATATRAFLTLIKEL